MVVKESELKSIIIDYLRLCGAFCWVQASIGIKGRYLNGKGMRRGVSDILGIYKGKFFAIEVKVGKNKASKEQESFMEDVRLYGGIAFCAYDLSDVDKNLIHKA